MACPKLGIKRIYPTTGKKFYDFGKSPVVSPYTDEAVPTSVLTPFASGSSSVMACKAAPADDEEETEGPELMFQDEVAAEESNQDTDADAEGDDALNIEDDGDKVEDDTVVVDEDDEDAIDLVEVEGDDEDER